MIYTKLEPVNVFTPSAGTLAIYDLPAKIGNNSPSKFVVLISSVGSSSFSGTVIHTDNRIYPLGHYSSQWSPKLFNEYIGSVVIVNENERR